MKLPLWSDIEIKLLERDDDLSSLERFIYLNEPEGKVEGENFRSQLLSLIEFVRKL